MNYLTILIIDDDVDLCTLLSTRLKKNNHVVKAHSKKAGYEALGRMRPDVILLDHNLPDGTGIGFLRKLRETSDLPVIMMTASDKAPIEKIAGPLGVIAILGKPFNMALLENLIKEKIAV